MQYERPSSGGAWLYLFALLVFIPGGTLIALAWLLVQEIQLDKELSA